MIPFSCPPVFVPSDSDGEGERHPADESSEVWHDRRHGHADAPERGLGAVQPAQTLLCLDDLREYPVMERRYFPIPCSRVPMFPCSHVPVFPKEASLSRWSHTGQAWAMSACHLVCCMIMLCLLLRRTPGSSVWRWIRTNGFPSTAPRWSPPTKANAALRRRRTSTPSQTKHTMTCWAVSALYDIKNTHSTHKKWWKVHSLKYCTCVKHLRFL